MTSFSLKLIKKCQEIFKRRSGVDIDVEQAEIILERLAKLGLLMIKTRKGGEEYDEK